LRSLPPLPPLPPSLLQILLVDGAGEGESENYRA
jgi:hypothetical protein